jgi:hypothetical protein
MKLYVDNQYTPGFIRLVTSLHALQYSKAYEIVSGNWDNEFKPTNTVVFLWDTNKKGLSQQILKHYSDGYKVFTFKKPFGKPLDLFKVSLLMLSQWKKMLEAIESEQGPFLFVINDSKQILKRVA